MALHYPKHERPKASIMKLTPHLTTLFLGSALTFSSAWLSSAQANDSHAATRATRDWLTIGQVYQRLETAGYRDVEKIERERGGYEARATNRQGERTKLSVNPQTGDITDRRAPSQRTNHAKETLQRSSTECNQRRCRDDLPPHPVTPPSSTSTPSAAMSSL
jgi:hypothetical protein